MSKRVATGGHPKGMVLAGPLVDARYHSNGFRSLFFSFSPFITSSHHLYFSKVKQT